MRYTCRLNGKPASYDSRFPGAYNARKDNLTGFWNDIYGSNHAVMIVNGFFENVPQHLYERRVLRPDEKEVNMVLRFAPRPAIDVVIACLWDRWSSPNTPDLLSYAAITDDPPAEVAAAGHNRCPINLTRNAAEKWLTPQGRTRSELFDVLEERQRPYYEHVLAAA